LWQEINMKIDRRVIFSIVLAGMVSVLAYGQSVGDQVIVGVRETAFRGNPSALGGVISYLAYEDALEVLEIRGDWLRCRMENGDGEGWVHSSAIVKPARGGLFASSGSSIGSQATTEEVALAGKGFNSEVEQRYASENDLDYRNVDRIESDYVFEVDELIAFLEEGGMNAEGAVR
jgi:hypothetical protein